MEPRTGLLQFFFVKTKKVCRCFASLSSEREYFIHGMYITALIRPSDVKIVTENSNKGRPTPEVSSIMRVLAERSLIGTYLYS